MGMTCAVYAVPTDRIDALRRDPAREIESIRTDDEVVLPNLGLEKSWAGLHYLLTGSPGFDDAGGVTNRPLAFLLQGGHSISDGAAYGGRLFTPGETKAIDTSVAGIQIAENLPHCAKAMKDLALIRSMTNKEGNHQRATYQMHTGYVPAGSVKHPSFAANVAVGTLVSAERGHVLLG